MKPKLFPDLPLVIVEWQDACMETGDEFYLGDESSMRHFGKEYPTEEPGFLVRIDEKNVVCALTRWPEAKRGGRSNVIPRKMVLRITAGDGSVIYERKISTRKRRAAATEKQEGA